MLNQYIFFHNPLFTPAPRPPPSLCLHVDGSVWTHQRKNWMRTQSCEASAWCWTTWDKTDQSLLTVTRKWISFASKVSCNNYSFFVFYFSCTAKKNRDVIGISPKANEICFSSQMKVDDVCRIALTPCQQTLLLLTFSFVSKWCNNLYDDFMPIKPYKY